MKHTFKPWHLLSLVLFAMGIAFTMSSCGDDEPSGTVIDYYLKVEEEFLVNGSSDNVGRYYNPKTRMMDAIRSVYPKANAQGADEIVLEVCEKEYAEYCEMYTDAGAKEHLTCMFCLMRVVKKGSKIKQSETLRRFIYDINPTETDIED